MITNCGCTTPPASFSKANRADFQTTVDGKPTDLYYLKNKNGVEITVTNFGARIVELWTPDKNGNFNDIVLGHLTVNDYIHFTGERFLGSAIGRFGNRIADGTFTLEGTEYHLPLNDSPNSLHGGNKGFDMTVWDAQQLDKQSILFSYMSMDMEEGYPGNLHVEMIYSLSDANELMITYRASTDRTTVINLTHHSFFNLHGEGEGVVNDHYLTIHADKYTPVNAVLIPTGEQAGVENTPMDFRKPTLIGARLNDPFEQLALARGYDHNWILNRKTKNDPEPAALVYDPLSGRTLEVWTTEPGIQFYGGNFFDDTTPGKTGKPYGFRSAFALETQHFPDSPNRSDFPLTVLRPGEIYKHICIYKFGCRKD
jgi:aldose 1-epimerase